MIETQPTHIHEIASIVAIYTLCGKLLIQGASIKALLMMLLIQDRNFVALLPRLKPNLVPVPG